MQKRFVARRCAVIFEPSVSLQFLPIGGERIPMPAGLVASDTSGLGPTTVPALPRPPLAGGGVGALTSAGAIGDEALEIVDPVSDRF